MDEARTLDLARRGDRASRDQLLRGLQDVWYRFCLGMTGDPDLAADAVQETAVRFLERLGEFRGDSALKTWSLGIAVNVVREMRRKQRRSVGLEVADESADPAPTADAVAGDAEQQARVRQLLADLPERQREALVLRFFEEMSVEETARSMGCAQGTIKATVHQALRSLKRRLETR